MTSGARFNKLLFGTFLNGYGGVAGCLLGIVCGIRKITCLQSHLGARGTFSGNFMILQIDNKNHVIEHSTFPTKSFAKNTFDQNSLLKQIFP